uniref:Uncharacterized protein n=1 Tax=Rhizophora mucronata TaxID=61149 RepID=A0A2P2PMG3_RHIMU
MREIYVIGDKKRWKLLFWHASECWPSKWDVAENIAITISSMDCSLYTFQHCRFHISMFFLGIVGVSGKEGMHFYCDSPTQNK